MTIAIPKKSRCPALRDALPQAVAAIINKEIQTYENFSSDTA